MSDKMTDWCYDMDSAPFNEPCLVAVTVREAFSFGPDEGDTYAVHVANKHVSGVWHGSQGPCLGDAGNGKPWSDSMSEPFAYVRINIPLPDTK